MQIYSYYSAKILYWRCRECMVWTPKHDLHSRGWSTLATLWSSRQSTSNAKKNCTSVLLLHFLFPGSQVFVCHGRNLFNFEFLDLVRHTCICPLQIKCQLCQGILVLDTVQLMTFTFRAFESNEFQGRGVGCLPKTLQQGTTICTTHYVQVHPRLFCLILIIFLSWTSPIRPWRKSD